MRKALFAFLLLAACIWAADFSIPFQKKAPVIDGQFAPGEWDCAVAFSGTARNMDARRTTVWLAYDKSTMYVALQAETPLRGKLRSVPGGRNNSDSLELWFFPPQELRTIGSLKFGTFQIIVSSEDDIFAEHNNPGYGLATQKWKHGATIKSQVKDKVWTMEMAIPLKNMGITGNPEGDWKILACRNYGIAPAYQGPMTDAGGFMDPTTYSTCHLKKDCLAIQQLYADNARLPLRFRVTNTGTKAASAGIALKLSEGKELALDKKLELKPAQSEEVDFTKGCDAEGGNCKVAVQANGWNRTFNWRPPEMPIWRNTESYQTLFCSFDAGLPNMLEYSSIENAEIKVKPPVEGEAATVPGPSATRKILDLTNSKLNFPKNKLSSPGAISFWMRVKEPLKKGQSYRRFMGTTFTPNGYIFFQEQNQGGMLLGAQYFGPQNKSPKLVLLGRRPQPNDWMHISINFLPGVFEVYINGIRRALLQHKLDIDLSKVGALSLENASFADLAVYSRPLTAAEITSLSQGDKPVTGTVGWYQSIETIVADLVLDCKAVPDRKLQLQVRNVKDAVLENIIVDFAKAVTNIEGGKQMATLHATYPLSKKLADGKYSFFLSKPGSETPLIERAFEVKTYPWMNNNIGKADKLVEGFTPLKRKGNKLSAVLKDVTLGKSGLPESVIANGQEVLARPVKLVALNNKGKELSWKCKAPAFTGEKETLITAKNQLECDALKIEADIRMEQDGLIRYDWKLTAGKNALPERLYVDIPVKKEVATLYHAIGESLRHNPADIVPEGQGLVFSSRSIQQPNFESFLPYIWVGDDNRGICYAADWDKGWCHSKKRDGVELHREKDGTVVIRLNLLNEPKKLQADNTITFALLPSPVKPMPKGWRGWRDAFTDKATQLSRCLYSPPYWGSLCSWASRYPAFGDFGYWDKLFEAQKTGKVDQQYVDAWIERLLKARGTVFGGSINSKSPEEAKTYLNRHVGHAFRTLAGLNKYQDKSIVYCYTCNLDSSKSLPEYPVIRDEWVTGQMLNLSYVDYAIYYLDKMLEHGFKGIYNDNVFLKGGFSWANGEAWIDETGTIHPSMGLWRSREYHRRQAITMQERGLKPWITAHHTNTNNLVTLGYATNTMGMEWKYGANDFQERFTSGYIRAVCSGRQGGFFPTILDGIVGAKSPEQKTWATRTMLAALLPHEVQPTCPRGSNYSLIASTLNKLYDFGTWKDDCQVSHFWDAASPVKCSNPDLKQVTYHLGNEMLTFIGSFAEQDCNAEMEYGTPIASAANDENQQPLEVSGSKVKFFLKKHDFIIIRAKAK